MLHTSTGISCYHEEPSEIPLVTVARFVVWFMVGELFCNGVKGPGWRGGIVAVFALTVLRATEGALLTADGAAVLVARLLAVGVSREPVLGYGAGMALSYVEGYLRLVLPELRAISATWGAREGVTVFPKLLVVLPRSLYCVPDLADWSSRLEACSAPPPLQQDMAGVKNRMYCQSVYRINVGRRPRFVMAECATPLHTLHAVRQRAAQYGRLATVDHRRVSSEFEATLRAVLETDPVCRGRVGLVPYNDCDPTEDLAELLLQQLPLEDDQTL